MAKIKIEGLSSDFSQYEWLEEYEHVFPLVIQDFEWFTEVTDSYPHPELLRHYWDEAILEFLNYIAMYQFLEGESIENHHRLASPRIDSVDWLIKRIKNIRTARMAFERFIKPDTSTGQGLLKSFNEWRAYNKSTDPLGLDGKAVQFNRKGMIVEKEAKDGK